MSEETEQTDLSFHERVIVVQGELKVPKGQQNNFGKYKYRSAEDILEMVKPINQKYGLRLTLSDAPVLIGDWHYIQATATLTDGKESIEVTAYARESVAKKGMDDSQITGTASSYARKYALNGLYLIDDTKDADTDEYKQQVDSAESKPIDAIKAQALEQKISQLADLVTIKTGEEVTAQRMIEKMTDTKFLTVVPIEKLDTEQYMTIVRYADELTKAYAKK